MRLTKKLLILLMAFGLVAAACGDDDAETTTTAPPAQPTTTTTSAPTTTGGDGGTTTTTTTTTTTSPPPAAEIATDVGVTDDEIRIGLLSDLSGPFGGLVGLIVAGQQAFWAKVNAEGGIAGRQVVLEIEDTSYDVQTHVQLYGELKDEVVAFGHSTGSPHTIAILEDLKDDNLVAIPLTWYSGWTDPERILGRVLDGTAS